MNARIKGKERWPGNREQQDTSPPAIRPRDGGRVVCVGRIWKRTGEEGEVFLGYLLVELG
jgi:hypothetical protein